MKDRTTALTVLRRATKIGTTTTATKAGAPTGAPSYSTFIGATPREDLILTYANAAASHAHRQLHAAAARVGAKEQFEQPGMAAISAAQMALRAALVHVEGIPQTAD